MPSDLLASGHRTALGKGAESAQFFGTKAGGCGSFPAIAGSASGPLSAAGLVNAGVDGFMMGAGVFGLDGKPAGSNTTCSITKSGGCGGNGTINAFAVQAIAVTVNRNLVDNIMIVVAPFGGLVHVYRTARKVVH